MGSARELLADLEEALALLRDHAGNASAAEMPAEALPDLVDQCVGLAGAVPGPGPLRSVHHMACTGGTLICKALSVMPNVTLLSEIDPLSKMTLPGRGNVPMFRPSDLIYAGRVALRPPDDAMIEVAFLSALSELHRALSGKGGYLCIRDHAHSQFCTGRAPEDRATLHALLQRAAPVRAVITVRHPLDSFLSLTNNEWLHFYPATIEEYARRYLEFLDRHAGLPVYRYEDFVADPEAVLAELCAALELPYRPGAEKLIGMVRLSGDSGRRSRRIAFRPRRAVPEALAEEAARSENLHALCERLGYDGM